MRDPPPLAIFEPMDWIFFVLVAAVVLALFLMLNRSQLVSENDARRWLQEGAMVIDVRSPSEHQQNALPGAMNIPLNQLREQIANHVSDKNQILLLHCAAGGRSALGRRALKELGYARSYNLGSFARAARILAGAKDTPPPQH